MKKLYLHLILYSFVLDTNAQVDMPIWTGSHNSYVLSVAFSPDGNYLASGSHDNTIKLWDVKNGSTIWTGSHNSYVNSVAFSPDGNYLASGSNDKTIKLWSIIISEIRKFLAKKHPIIFASKDEFESTTKYYKRIKEQNKLISDYRETYQSEKREENKKNEIVKLKKIKNSIEQIDFIITSIGKYDADYGTFSISILKQTLTIKIPNSEARTFKENYKNAKVTGLKFLKNNLKDYEITNIVIHHPITNSKYKFGKEIDTSILSENPFEGEHIFDETKTLVMAFISYEEGDAAHLCFMDISNGKEYDFGYPTDNNLKGIDILLKDKNTPFGFKENPKYLKKHFVIKLKKKLVTVMVGPVEYEYNYDWRINSILLKK